MNAAEGYADVLALQGSYEEANLAYTQAVELGSISALGKQTILSGDLERLAQHSFTPELHPWAQGTQAWLLAQTGELTAALNLAQTALAESEAAARANLTELVQTLKAGKRPGEYGVWLQRFVKAVLQGGISAFGLLEMPPVMTNIIKIIVRKNGLKLPEIAAALNQVPQDTQKILDEMVAKGYIQQVQNKKEVLYKARFGRKADRTLSSDIWSALDN